MKILVVDDESDLAQTLARFLEGLGHDCGIALSVQGAIDSITHDLPDVVLSDVQLPDGDGFDVMVHVRRTLPQTPVIIMTAYHSPTVEQAARQSGAAAYLRKPFALVDLGKIIEIIQTRHS